MTSLPSLQVTILFGILYYSSKLRIIVTDMQNHDVGNPEHPGRVRGVSSKISWKDRFGEEWKGVYKKRDKHKEEMKDFFEKKAE